MSPTKAGALHFSIDARHVRQLGRELVADRITAVSELIKNAYDADATHVEVLFSTDARVSSGGTLVLRDDGTGMDLADVAQRWMVISTGYKDINNLSEVFGRKRAGQKGIGRFATESLGSALQLRSTKRGSPDRIVVDFDWARSYAGGQQLDSVENPYRIESAGTEEHGTELVVRGLHDPWDDRALHRVRDAVFLLQPPFRVAPVYAPDDDELGQDPGFKVTVRYDHSMDEPSASSEIDSILAAATAWVEATVDEAGVLLRRVSSAHLGLDETERSASTYLLTGAFSFRAAYFIFKRDALDPDASFGVRRARQLAELYGGIRLYRDGMRILPYGEPDNDWLTLDSIYRRRGQVLAPIGNSNFLGEVLITRDENVLLIDTASREGVLENEAFVELQSILRDTLVWAVNRVAAIRQKKVSAGGGTEKAPTPREALVDDVAAAAQRVADAQSDAQRSAALAQLSVTTAAALAEARRSDRQQDAERLAMLDELSLLRVLASVGSSIAVFSHEVRAVLTQSIAAIGDVARDVDEGAVPAPDSIQKAETGLNGVSELATYLDVYISHTGRRVREEQTLASVLSEFTTSVAPLLERRGITVESAVQPAHLRTQPMSRSELIAMLYNLLTNALKALDDETLTDRRIKVEAVARGSAVVIRFSDTGSGIDEHIRDRVFDAFVTTTDDSDAELGAGTGLGLKIVADIAENNGGSASIGVATSPYVTCMELSLPASSETNTAT